MNIKHAFSVSLLNLIIQSVHAITMTKEELLNLNLKDYEKTDVCPEFSYGKSNSFIEFSCGFSFYCLDDNNCQLDKNYTSPYFEFTENDGSIKKYIKGYCPKDFENCTTEICTADSDCLSNKCYNGVCIRGKSKFTECVDNVDDSDYEHPLQVIKCGKPDGEECYFDRQCPGRCVSNSCRSHVYLTPINPIHLEYLIYIAIAFVILVMLFLCILKLISNTNSAI